MNRLTLNSALESTLLVNGYNFLFFQTAWFIAVLSTSPIALAYVAPLLILQLWLGNHWRRDIRTGLAFTLVGALTESFLIGSQSYFLSQSTQGGIAVPPTWLLLMWFCLGISTHYSLAWLRTVTSKPWILQMLFAAVSGPLAYKAAEALQAIAINERGEIYIGILWALAFPTALLITRVGK